MSDDLLSRFQAFLRQSDQEKAGDLTEVVGSILSRRKADVVEAVYRCAVPRWFNIELLAALLEDDVPPSRVEEIFYELQSLPITLAHRPLGFAYRTGVREHLLEKLRAMGEERYVLLHRRAFEYFDGKLNLPDQDLRRTLTQEQADYLRERVYHLLFIDPDEGFEVLDQLFQSAHRLHLLGEAATLVSFGREHCARASSPLCPLRLDYYEAVLENARGNWSGARDTLLKMSSRGMPPDFRAQVLAQLGTGYVGDSQYDKAIEVFRQSKQLWDELGDVRSGVALTNNLGNAYLAKQDLRAAEKCFQEALEGMTALGDESERAVAHNNLGNVYAQQRRWKKAIKSYEQSLAIKRQTNELFGIATTQANLGTIYHRMSRGTYREKQSIQQREQAIDYYQQSAATFRQLGARSRLARSLYSLALLHQQAGQSSLARQPIGEAIEIFEALRLPGLETAQKLAERVGL